MGVFVLATDKFKQLFTSLMQRSAHFQFISKTSRTFASFKIKFDYQQTFVRRDQEVVGVNVAH